MKPIACKYEYIVVDPTNFIPLLIRSLDIISDKLLVVFPISKIGFSLIN